MATPNISNRIFVDVSNSGGTENGDYWSTAYGDLASAMSDGSLAAGWTIVIAPGLYTGANNRSITPGAAGSDLSSNTCTILVDTEELIEDGADTPATHGQGAGYAVFDAQGPTANNVFAASNNWVYWTLKNFIGVGGQDGILINPSTDPTTGDVALYNCIGIGEYAGINIAKFTASATKLYRCIGISANSAGNQYRRGFAIENRKGTTFNGTAEFEMVSCYGRGGRYGLLSNGNGATDYTYIDAKNCDFISPDLGTGYHAARSESTNYNKTDMTRCFLYGNSDVTGFNVGSSFTNTYYYGPDATPASATRKTSLPKLFHPWHTFADSADVVGELADYSGGLSGEQQYDIFGQLLSTDIGIEQYTANDEPAPPGYTHDANGGRGVYWSNDYTSTGSGGGGGFLTGPGKLAR